MESETKSKPIALTRSGLCLIVALAIGIGAIAVGGAQWFNSTLGAPKVATASAIDEPENSVLGIDEDKIDVRNGDPVDPWSSDPFGSGTWDPFQEMQNMRQRMDSIFNESFGRFDNNLLFQDSLSPLTSAPQGDLSETDEEYIVQFDMPDLEESSVDVSIEDSRLTIKASRQQGHEEEVNGRVIRRERRTEQFQRSLTLPSPVVEAKLATEYKDGVFTIRIPKDTAVAESNAQPPHGS